MASPSRSILLVLLVYNGEEFVPACLDSIARVDRSNFQADVLVLDDASPAPGWSERLQDLCVVRGFGYYRTPRNLGIPRNMNLGLLHGVANQYSAVVLLNSDILVPTNLLDTLIPTLQQDDWISSATAWSNSASVYSLPVDRPDRFAESPQLVDEFSTCTAEEFGHQAITIPTGVGFCMAISTRAITDVGLMDPVFGRGYSEEVDWCLRSHVAGYRSVLAPACFVYHAGSATTRNETGVGESVVNAHNAIVDERYPLYAGQVQAYQSSSIPGGVIERGSRRILLSAAARSGYRVDACWLPYRPGDDGVVRFTIEPLGEHSTLRAEYQGVRMHFAVGAGGVLPTVEAIVGSRPREIRIHDRGPVAAEIMDKAAHIGVPIVRLGYNERVF